jgi:Uma2 family endonuclease
MAAEARKSATIAEFEALPETNRILELIEGEIIMSPPPVTAHQRLLLRSARSVDELKPDGEVFIAPIGVYLDAVNVVEPDVVWVAAESACKIEEKGLIGAPDLVIEVLSPGSIRRDKVTKFRLYERVGVREYWIANTEGYLEVFTLMDGKFTLLGVFSADEAFDSPVLNKRVDLSRLFA